MNNSLRHKPDYTLHRTVTAADGAVLPALETKSGRGAVNASGYNSLHGFVKLTGGTTPTVSLVPLERVTYKDGSGNEVHELLDRGITIGPLSVAGGLSFAFDTPGGGCWLVRASAVTGAPTAVDIYLAGGLRANEGSI